MVRKSKKIDSYIIQLILFIGLIFSIFFLSSCKKPLPSSDSCLCGEVILKEQGIHPLTGKSFYAIRALNNCSGNDTIVEVSSVDFNAVSKGEDKCFSQKW